MSCERSLLSIAGHLAIALLFMGAIEAHGDDFHGFDGIQLANGDLLMAFRSSSDQSWQMRRTRDGRIIQNIALRDFQALEHRFLSETGRTGGALRYLGHVRRRDAERDEVTGCAVTQHEYDVLAPFRLLAQTVAHATDLLLPIEIRNIDLSEGLEIDVMPAGTLEREGYWSVTGATHAARENSGHLINFFGVRALRIGGRTQLEVSSLDELDRILARLPAASVSRLRILAHMEPGYIEGISQGASNLHVENRFMPGARIEFLGCNFAEGTTGDHALERIAKRYLTGLGGTVSGFTQYSGPGLPVFVDATALKMEDYAAFGSTKTYELVPGGRDRLTVTHSIFNNSW